MRTRRLWGIGRTLSRYRLDEIAAGLGFLRPLRYLRWFSRSSQAIAQRPRGERLRLALEELGPIFVKFGQVLSTRRDLIPADIADELAKLQDRVPPYDSQIARQKIEASLKAPIDELFGSFTDKPVASASIAQVHNATLHSGEQVVVKVLRPGVHDKVKRDVAVLYTLASWALRFNDEAHRLRPLEVVEEFDAIIHDELDLSREAANASLLRRNFETSRDLYVPQVYWSHVGDEVLTLERLDGIPISDVQALTAQGVDLKKLSECGVRIFFTQVFRDNFFHADMHPGNIWVAKDRPDDPYYLSLDFGIMGSLTDADQYYLAENFRAFFNRDYRRVAELHIESGWVPSGTRLDTLEGAVRTVCEPNFAKPLSEISFAEVLLKLFKVARRFDMKVQPQLVLLQKTLFNIEGLGRQLYPDLDLWSTAQPVLEDIMRDKRSPEKAMKAMADRLPGWLERMPTVPLLVYQALNDAAVRRQDPPDEKARAQALIRERRDHWRVTAVMLVLIAAALTVIAPPIPPDRPLHWLTAGLTLAAIACWWKSKPKIF